jgi:hypothetical protein
MDLLLKPIKKINAIGDNGFRTKKKEPEEHQELYSVFSQ